MVHEPQLLSQSAHLAGVKSPNKPMGPKKLSNRDLLRVCLEKDDEAHWNELLNRIRPVIASVIIKTLSNPSPDRVDDFIQQTYVKLFDNGRRALRSLRNDHEKSLFAFVRMVAFNVVQDSWRDPDESEKEELMEEHQVTESTEELMARQAEMKRIERLLPAVAAGPNCARDCRIFWMYHLLRMTAQEISLLPTIDLTVKGVEAVLFRLMRELRKSLGLLPEPGG